MAKVLIIRFSSIGDIVLTSAVVRCVKNQLENAEVHYVTKLKYKDLVEHNPYIDKKHYLDTNLRKLTSELAKEKFDYIIDLHHNLRSLIVKSRIGGKSYSFNKLNFEKWMLVNLKVNKLPQKHIVDRYMDTVKKLGVENDEKGLDFFVPNSVNAVNDLPENYGNGYIAFAIGALHNTKKLPLSKILSICKKINKPIVLLGDSNDREGAINIVEDLGSFTKMKLVYNACGRYSLLETASIIQGAEKVIAHDTGLMHIAAAFKKEVISIWGNTVPELGMYPYFGSQSETGKSHIIEVKDLSCRPCSKLGYEKCPKDHFDCMEKINLESIAELAN
ncbi:MAG: glycosyl transferase [Bacteroidetes bacterium]|nr:glycosyltransferase family 9 protein [Bacteroidia bacterium]PCH67793.1 MAG: glycosyl transferase [Bacteroidota bacterium]